WLSAAAIFSAIYRPARSGRKVAYLTVTSFAVLAVSIGVSLLVPSEHGGERQKAEVRVQAPRGYPGFRVQQVVTRPRAHLLTCSCCPLPTAHSLLCLEVPA